MSTQLNLLKDKYGTESMLELVLKSSKDEFQILNEYLDKRLTGSKFLKGLAYSICTAVFLYSAAKISDHILNTNFIPEYIEKNDIGFYGHYVAVPLLVTTYNNLYYSISKAKKILQKRIKEKEDSFKINYNPID